MENMLIALAFLGGIAVLIIVGMSLSLYLHAQSTAGRGAFAQSNDMYKEHWVEESITSNPAYQMRPETGLGTRVARGMLITFALLALAAVSSIIVLFNGLLH